MEVIELQVYLVNNEDKILKKFQRVTDPSSSKYGMYSKESVIEKKKKESAIQSLSILFNERVKETPFEDVLSVKTSLEKDLPKNFPRWIKRVEYNPNFIEIVDLVKERENSFLTVLPALPKISQGLKERLNLECMIWGIEGKTLLADAETVWRDMPAVTVFTKTPSAYFSKIFKRHSHAFYQNHFVNTYLWDPDVKSHLRKIEFFSDGRAAPDIYLEDLSVFLEFLEKINQKRKEKGFPLIGFLNPFFYQNAHAFKRPYTGAPIFPDSFALWSANRGLGIPHYGGLLDAFENLGGLREGLFQKFFKNLVLFQSNQD